MRSLIHVILGLKTPDIANKKRNQTKAQMATGNFESATLLSLEDPRKT